jgi:hypothetical protein
MPSIGCAVWSIAAYVENGPQAFAGERVCHPLADGVIVLRRSRSGENVPNDHEHRRDQRPQNNAVYTKDLDAAQR